MLAHVTVTNVGTDASTFSDSNQTLLDADGREFSADSGTAVMYLPDSQAFLNQINPGNKVDGVLVFDVPEGLAPAAIELRESPPPVPPLAAQLETDSAPDAVTEAGVLNARGSASNSRSGPDSVVRPRPITYA